MRILYAFLSGDGFSGSFSGSGVAFGGLSPNGQPLAMAHSHVTSDVSESGDVLTGLSSEHSLDDVIAIENAGDSTDFVVIEFVGLDVVGDLGFLEDCHGHVALLPHPNPLLCPTP